MLTNSTPLNVPAYRAFGRCPPLPLDRRDVPGEGPCIDPETRALRDSTAVSEIDPFVTVSPADSVQRRSVSWDGMAAEIVQATKRGRTEYRFRAPFHLLALYEQGMCGNGDTFVEGLP